MVGLRRTSISRTKFLFRGNVMAMGTIICAHCKCESEKENGAIARALQSNKPLFCNRVCFGLSRRKNRTDAEKVALKAEYDRKYRAKNLASIKAKKAAYFKRTYDPVKAAAHRQTRMAYHVEYCRQPEYRKKKKAYDRKYCATRNYGQFAEAFLALTDLESEVFSRLPRAQVKYQNGATNKTQNRRRDYVRQTNSR